MCVVDSGDYGAAGGLGPFLEEIRRSIFSSLGTNHTVQVCEFMKVLKPSQSIISSWISSPLPMTDYQAVVKIPINRLKWVIYDRTALRLQCTFSLADISAFAFEEQHTLDTRCFALYKFHRKEVYLGAYDTITIDQIFKCLTVDPSCASSVPKWNEW